MISRLSFKDSKCTTLEPHYDATLYWEESDMEMRWILRDVTDQDVADAERLR